MRIIALNPGTRTRRKKRNPKKGAEIMAKRRRKSNPKRRRRNPKRVISRRRILKNPIRKRRQNAKRRRNPAIKHRRRRNPSMRGLNLRGIIAELKPMLIGAGGAIAFNYAFNYVIKKTSLDVKYYPYIKLALAVVLPRFIKGKMGITASLVIGALSIKEALEYNFPTLALAGYEPFLGFSQFRASSPAVGFSQFRASSPAVSGMDGLEWRDFN